MTIFEVVLMHLYRVHAFIFAPLSYISRLPRAQSVGVPVRNRDAVRVVAILII